MLKLKYFRSLSRPLRVLLSDVPVSGNWYKNCDKFI